MSAPVIHATPPSTGWRDIGPEIQEICDANGLTYSVTPGWPSPRMRWRGGVVDIQASFTLSGGGLNAVDFSHAFGQDIQEWRCGPGNDQISGALTGSAGVIHWSPGSWIRFWSAGRQRLFVSWPAWSGLEPTRHPGVDLP